LLLLLLYWAGPLPLLQLCLAALLVSCCHHQHSHKLFAAAHQLLWLPVSQTMDAAAAAAAAVALGPMGSDSQQCELLQKTPQPLPLLNQLHQ
jgi:hypothetical protein